MERNLELSHAFKVQSPGHINLNNALTSYILANEISFVLSPGACLHLFGRWKRLYRLGRRCTLIYDENKKKEGLASLETRGTSLNHNKRNDRRVPRTDFCPPVFHPILAFQGVASACDKGICYERYYSHPVKGLQSCGRPVEHSQAHLSGGRIRTICAVSPSCYRGP